MRRILLYISPLLVAGAIAGVLIPALASQNSSPSPAGASDASIASINDVAAGPQQYAAKFVCGTVTEDEFQVLGAPVVPGTYETAINVHNPSVTDTVYAIKLAAVSLREPELGPVAFFDLDLYPIEPNYAFEIDCVEIEQALGHTAPFIKGFVVILGILDPVTMDGAPLDVTAVYSAQHVNVVDPSGAPAEGLGQAIDVEPVPVQAQPWPGIPDPTAPSNVYAAKFVCGTSTGPEPVVAGDYASAINVQNPSWSHGVEFRKKVVLANPEGNPEWGAISDWRIHVDEDALPALMAFEIDCPDIRSFTFPPEALPLPDLIKGFVVIETIEGDLNGALDVVPVYTVRRMTAAPNNGYGMDIEVLRIAKKAKSEPPAIATPTPTATEPPPTPTPTVTPTPEKPFIDAAECTHQWILFPFSVVIITCHLWDEPLDGSIFDWEIFYADQHPPWSDEKPYDWQCSSEGLDLPWQPIMDYPDRAKCKDLTWANPWYVCTDHCRDMVLLWDFVPSFFGAEVIELHATDENQENLGTFRSYLAPEPPLGCGSPR